MRNIALMLMYKGSAYHGWQRQNNAVTVQETLEKAIYRVCRENVVLYGCGRTDAGVHALHYVCNFHSQTKIPDDKIPFALNCVLPDDIRITGAKTVDEKFHARYSVKKKRYIYKVLNSPHGDVFLQDLAWHYRRYADIERMREACGFFVGEHDFSAFCASGAQTNDFVRTVYSLDVSRNNDQITVDICGNGFLYNMVRIIAGTLMYIGDGRLEPHEAEEIIASCDRRRAGITAPPHGLYMADVTYDTDLF